MDRKRYHLPITIRVLRTPLHEKKKKERRNSFIVLILRSGAAIFDYHRDGQRGQYVVGSAAAGIMYCSSDHKLAAPDADAFFGLQHVSHPMNW